MSFVRGSVKYQEKNFWEANPLIRYMQPFNEMYDTDDGGENSSKAMWCIYFFCDPNEDENIFYRVRNKEEMLKETFYPELDLKDPIFDKCKIAYPEMCLTSISKALKDKKDWLIKREQFIVNQEYSLDNFAELDKMASSSKKIWDEFKKTEDEFQVEKGKIEVKGGRKQSKAELKQI